MTYDEICDLLAAAASFDRRTIGEADSEAWEDALGDLPFADARAAVIAHYRETRDWIMPADVYRRVKAIRSDRVAHSLIPAPPHELADDPAAYRWVLAANIRVAADGDLPMAGEGPKMIGPPPGKRTGGPPVSLSAAIRDLRRDMGTGRGQRGAEAPEVIAARQVAERRAAEAERDKTEEAS